MEAPSSPLPPIVIDLDDIDTDDDDDVEIEFPKSSNIKSNTTTTIIDLTQDDDDDDKQQDRGKQIMNQDSGEDDDADERDCIICYEKVNMRGCLDVCDHMYCFKCINTWAQSSNECPMCKRRFHTIHRMTFEEARDSKLSDTMATVCDRKRKAGSNERDSLVGHKRPRWTRSSESGVDSGGSSSNTVDLSDPNVVHVSDRNFGDSLHRDAYNTSDSIIRWITTRLLSVGAEEMLPLLLTSPQRPTSDGGRQRGSEFNPFVRLPPSYSAEQERSRRDAFARRSRQLNSLVQPPQPQPSLLGHAQVAPPPSGFRAHFPFHEPQSTFTFRAHITSSLQSPGNVTVAPNNNRIRRSLRGVGVRRQIVPTVAQRPAPGRVGASNVGVGQRVSVRWPGEPAPVASSSRRSQRLIARSRRRL